MSDINDIRSEAERAAYGRGVEDARAQIKALIQAQSAAGYVETAGWALLLDEIEKLPKPGKATRYVCQCGDPDCDAIPYTDDREKTCPHCGGQGCGECANTGAVPL